MNDAILAAIGSGGVKGIDSDGNVSKKIYKYPVYPKESISAGDFAELIDRREGSSKEDVNAISSDIDWTKAYIRFDKDTVVKLKCGPGEVIAIPQDIRDEYIKESRYESGSAAKEYIAEFYDNNHILKKKIVRNVSLHNWYYEYEHGNPLNPAAKTDYILRTLTISEYKDGVETKTVTRDVLKYFYKEYAYSTHDYTTIIYSDKTKDGKWVPIDNLDIDDNGHVTASNCAETGENVYLYESGMYNDTSSISIIQQKEGVVVVADQVNVRRNVTSGNATPSYDDIYINFVRVEDNNIYVCNQGASYFSRLTDYETAYLNTDIQYMHDSGFVMTITYSKYTLDGNVHYFWQLNQEIFLCTWMDNKTPRLTQVTWDAYGYGYPQNINPMTIEPSQNYRIIYPTTCPKLQVGVSNTFFMNNKKCVAVVFNGYYYYRYDSTTKFNYRSVIDIYETTSGTPTRLSRTYCKTLEGCGAGLWDPNTHNVRCVVSDYNITNQNTKVLTILSTSETQGKTYSFNITAGGSSTAPQTEATAANLKVDAEIPYRNLYYPDETTPYYNGRIQMYPLSSSQNKHLIICNYPKYAQPAMFLTGVSLTNPIGYLPQGFTAPKQATKLKELHLEEGTVVILELIDEFTGQTIHLCVNVTKNKISQDIPNVIRYVKKVTSASQEIHGMSLQSGYDKSIVKVALGKNKEA